MTGSRSEHRVVIEHVRPTVECGRFPAKAAAGQPVEVTASIFADGHDLLMALVRHGRPARGRVAPRREEVWLEALGNDAWRGLIVPTATGSWEFEVVAMADPWATWVRDLRRRIEAGQEVALEVEEGALMVERRLAAVAAGGATRTGLSRLLATLRSDAGLGVKLAAVEAAGTTTLMRATADRGCATLAGPYQLTVDRELATFSAWYEMFPRSEGAQPPRSGTLETAGARLPAIAAMGFDVVYLPPIHPIGHTFRKGANNSLEALPGDVGSPWAIGDESGGHTAVHPDLGSLDDFDAFVARAGQSGLEVALDYALQCSPDHPWVRRHPEWFRHRPDGSIRYAENPPKRYQDIYPLNFDDADRNGLYEACRDILHFWIGHGVRVFRVDNPHTKPLPFWERLIGDVRSRHPEVLFLAEAFTRPAVMHRLGKIGFSQSYTYFTWRVWKEEIAEYLTELSQTEAADFYRPNFWVNTPDILHEVLQKGGPAAFRLRAVLAALCAPSWGMYSGYELFENQPVREGSEEYLDSEKYQLRPRDWNQPDNLIPFITRLNQIRRRHRSALSLMRTLRVQPVDGDAILAVSRRDDAGDDVLLVVVNLDPTQAHESTTWLDLAELGLDEERPFLAHDELGDTTFTWQGPRNFVRLDPAWQVAHVLHLRPLAP